MTKSAKVTPLHTENDLQRIKRGAFVKELLANDARSIRYTAAQIGISHTALGDRLNGKSPFLADELEEIARVLKIDPIKFYNAYINAESPRPDEPSEGKESRLRDSNSWPLHYKWQGSPQKHFPDTHVAPVIALRA